MHESCLSEHGYALRMTGLAVGYKHRTIASDINLALERGQLTCLVGSNGVGKSTLLRTLCKFQPPITGRISVSIDCRGAGDHNAAIKRVQSKLAWGLPSVSRVNEVKGTPLQWSPADRQEYDLSSLSPSQVAALIGVVLTERIDSANITAREVVALGRSPFTDFWGRMTDSDRRIVDESISMVGIDPLSNRKMHQLSDGERQKVMIAKTLAQQTPIILLDEPTAFLDYPSKVETLQLLHRLCHEQGKTVLLSTHDIDIAIPMTDCLWHMTGKEIVVVKNTADIRGYLENNLSLHVAL